MFDRGIETKQSQKNSVLSIFIEPLFRNAAQNRIWKNVNNMYLCGDGENCTRVQRREYERFYTT